LVIAIVRKCFGCMAPACDCGKILSPPSSHVYSCASLHSAISPSFCEVEPPLRVLPMSLQSLISKWQLPFRRSLARQVRYRQGSTLSSPDFTCLSIPQIPDNWADNGDLKNDQHSDLIQVTDSTSTFDKRIYVAGQHAKACLLAF
jgi:hypothetical protein